MPSRPILEYDALPGDTCWAAGAGTIDDVVRLAHKQTVSDGNNAVIKRMQRDARFAKLRASAPGGALSPERSGGPLLAGSQPSHVSEVRSARPLGEAQEAPHPRGTPGGSANIRQPPAAGSECKQQPPEDSAQVRSSSSTAAVGGGASTAPAAGIASAGAAAGIASGEAAVGGASAEAVAGAGSAAAGQAAALRQQAGPRPAGLFEGHSDVSSTAFKSLDSMRTASDMEKGLAASCGPTPPNDPPRVASMTDEVPFMGERAAADTPPCRPQAHATRACRQVVEPWIAFPPSSPAATTSLHPLLQLRRAGGRRWVSSSCAA